MPATYLGYTQYTDSKEAWLLGRKILRASNGAPRGRSFFTGRKKVFQIAHRGLTNDEKNALGAFYDTNAGLSFFFPFEGDGVTYTVIFGAADIEWLPMEGGRWNCAVEMLQT